MHMRSRTTVYCPEAARSGEHFLYGLDLTALGYECTAHLPTAAATHVVLTRAHSGGGAA